jgi:hypothetical protein
MSALVVDAIPRTGISPRLDVLLSKDNVVPPTTQPIARSRHSNAASKTSTGKRAPSARADALPSLTSQRTQHLTLRFAAIEQEQQEWSDHRAGLGLGPGAACVFAIPATSQELVEPAAARDHHVHALLSEPGHGAGNQSVEYHGYRLERERYVPHCSFLISRSTLRVRRSALHAPHASFGVTHITGASCLNTISSSICVVAASHLVMRHFVEL